MLKFESTDFPIVGSRKPGFSCYAFGLFISAALDLLPVSIAIRPYRFPPLREYRLRFAHIQNAETSIYFLFGYYREVEPLGMTSSVAIYPQKQAEVRICRSEDEGKISAFEK